MPPTPPVAVVVDRRDDASVMALLALVGTLVFVRGAVRPDAPPARADTSADTVSAR